MLCGSNIADYAVLHWRMLKIDLQISEFQSFQFCLKLMSQLSMSFSKYSTIELKNPLALDKSLRKTTNKNICVTRDTIS